MMSVALSRAAVGAGISLRAAVSGCSDIDACGQRLRETWRCHQRGTDGVEGGIFRVLLMGFERDGDLACADANCRADFGFRDRGNARPEPWGSRGPRAASAYVAANARLNQKKSRAALVHHMSNTTYRGGHDA